MVDPSKKTTSAVMIAATRNEGPFLLEWIAYHRMIGFERIVIYDLGSVDGSKLLLEKLHAAGEIEYVDFAPAGDDAALRVQAWNDALKLPVVKSAEWVAALDIAEFLVVHSGDGNLADLFKATPDADVISPCLRIFNGSDCKAFSDQLITQNTVMAISPKGTGVGVANLNAVKTMVRQEILAALRPHRPVFALGIDTNIMRWLNGSGKQVDENFKQSGWRLPDGFRARALCEVHQYKVRNIQSFILQDVLRLLPGTEQTPLDIQELARLGVDLEENSVLTERDKELSSLVSELKNDADIKAAHIAAVNAHVSAVEAMANHLIDNAETTAENAELLSYLDGAPPELSSENMAEVYPAPPWLIELRQRKSQRGFYQSFKASALQYTERSKDVLIVSFDNLAEVSNARTDRETWGYKFYQDEGWSHLGVMAFERHWFRDDDVFYQLEELSGKGFFRDFKHVVFIGTSMGAYAATAFADLVPGCTVLAFSPQSTLKRNLVPWESRFGFGRKRDWGGPYADAPENCGKARQIFVIYDPYFDFDARHAERYKTANVVHLKAWCASHKTALFFRQIGVLKEITRLAVRHQLTPAKYYSLYRERRNLPWYCIALEERVQATKRHKKLEAMIVKWMKANDKPRVAAEISEKIEAVDF